MPGPSARSVRPAPPETVGARLQRSAMAPGTRRVHRRAPDVRGARDARRRRGLCITSTAQRSARSSRSRLDEPRRSMRSPSPRDHVSPGRRLGGRPRAGASRPRRGAREASAGVRVGRCSAKTLRARAGSHADLIGVVARDDDRRRARALASSSLALEHVALATPGPGPRARVRFELDRSRGVGRLPRRSLPASIVRATDGPEIPSSIWVKQYAPAADLRRHGICHASQESPCSCGVGICARAPAMSCVFGCPVGRDGDQRVVSTSTLAEVGPARWLVASVDTVPRRVQVGHAPCRQRPQYQCLVALRLWRLFDYAGGGGLTRSDLKLFDGTPNFERVLGDISTAIVSNMRRRDGPFAGAGPSRHANGFRGTRSGRRTSAPMGGGRPDASRGQHTPTC